jgi:hypothetical protein
MVPRLFSIAFPVLLAGMAVAAPARADVYTWTDPSGRLNVSNVAPPEGVHVDRVVHVDPPTITPAAAAARDAARAAEVQALNERVAQLQDEVERARMQAPPAPYRVVAAPPPPTQVVVNVMAPPAQYAAPAAEEPPYCDPLMFGCPPFVYPAGVVVLRTPAFHRSHRFHRFEQPRAGHRMSGARPLPPIGHSRRH